MSEMNEKVLEVSEKSLSDSRYWIQKRLLPKLKPRDDLKRVNDCEKSPMERLLDAFYYEPKVFWKLGGDEEILLFTDLDDKIGLLDFSFCTDPENDPTVKYLNEHSIDKIFTGKNPDMMPDSVCIVEGGNGIVEINFKCSEKLKATGVDGSFLLNRNLDDPKFGVMVKGHGSEKHIIGYTDSDEQEPFVKTYYENGVTNRMVCEISSKV